jgi:uncharacterized protein (DUF1778 family)
MITIDLRRANDCPSGRYVTQVKTTKPDKRLIAEAAALLGMTQAGFIRTCTLQVARQVCDQLDAHTPEPERSSAVRLLRNPDAA